MLLFGKRNNKREKKAESCLSPSTEAGHEVLILIESSLSLLNLYASLVGPDLCREELLKPSFMPLFKEHEVTDGMPRIIRC